MSNIIAFRPTSAPSRAKNLTALIAGVAQGRRHPDDVFWLKENAELLGVLVATKAALEPDALSPFTEFYAQLEEKTRFYPQYYRFFLSICLDLEALGLGDGTGQAMADWVASAGLAEAELSDLQRAEARRLLTRRGAAKPVCEGALGARLRAFIERDATFALPNKKAAYELTHIVFYLSEYGQCDPSLSEAACASLEFAGVLAYLDQNHDLLAEVCTALRFAGKIPNEIWTKAVADAHQALRPTNAPPVGGMVDGYHAYLVTGWAQAVCGAQSFTAEVPAGPLHFVSDLVARSALGPLSECLFQLGAERRSDWEGVRGRVMSYLPPDASAILRSAEASTDKFEAFFEGFARAVPLSARRAG